MGQGFRIGVDARPLAFPGTGNARYLHQMLKRLIRLRPGDEWVLLSHRPLHPEFLDLLRSENVVLETDRSFLGRLGPLWLHFRLPRLAREHQIDLFWGTLAALPWRAKTRLPCPTMVNFHDLNAYIAPETMTLWNRLQHRLMNGETLRNAGIVLCLSANTRNDILSRFPDLPAGKLEVIYPGCELPRPSGAKPGEEEEALEGCILCVGTLEPRKNHAVLLAAYREARREDDSLPPLVIAGRKGWGEDSVYLLLESGELERENIFFLENPSDGKLRLLYEAASLLAFPSLHEGFGLPIIEALYLRKPVLLSDISIFREIAPEGEFADPREISSWKEALLRVSKKRRRGELQAPPFDAEFWSWDKRAEKLSAVINGALDAGASRK